MALLHRWREVLLFSLILADLIWTSVSLIVTGGEKAVWARPLVDFVRDRVFHKTNILTVIVLVHFADGIRWHLWPVTGIEFALYLLPSRNQSSVKVQIAAVCVKAIALSATLFACYFFPIITFPEPSGAFSCGCEQITFMVDPKSHDNELKQLFADCMLKEQGGLTAAADTSANANVIRSTLSRLMQGGAPPTAASTAPDSSSPFNDNQFSASKKSGGAAAAAAAVGGWPCKYKATATVYYPSDRHRHKSEGRSPWTSGRVIQDVSRLLQLPLFLLTYWTRFETSAVQLAPLSRKKRRYPVAIISHGAGMSGSMLSQMGQALACNGFIVGVLDHNDGSALGCSSVPCLEQFSWATKMLKEPNLVSAAKDPLLSPLVRATLVADTSSIASSPPTARSTASAAAAAQQQEYQSTSSDEFGRSVTEDASALHEFFARLSAPSKAQLSLPSAPRSMVAEQQLRRSPLSAAVRFRTAQVKRRVLEIRAARTALRELSGTSGSWIRDRIDWSGAAVVGVGLGGAAALVTCVTDRLVVMAMEAATQQTPSAMQSREFSSLIMLAPWLDPVDSELLRLHAIAQAFGFAGTAAIAAASLSQSVMLLMTDYPGLNGRLDVQLRVLSLIRECRGLKLVARLSRAKIIDLTDLGYVAPQMLCRLGLCGPRHPQTNCLVASRMVCNFLQQSYRRALFSFGTLRPSAAISAALGGATSGGGTESERYYAAAAAPTRHSASDTDRMSSKEERSAELRRTLQALEIMGLDKRKLFGIAARSPARGLNQLRQLWDCLRKQGGTNRSSHDLRTSVWPGQQIDVDIREGLTHLLGHEAVKGGDGVKTCAL